MYIYITISNQPSKVWSNAGPDMLSQLNQRFDINELHTKKKKDTVLRGCLDPRFSLRFTFAFNICWDPRYTVAKINTEMRNAGMS